MHRVSTGRASGADADPRLLVLFDIDGTLLQSDGAGREAFRCALLTVFGTTGPLDEYQFHGKTDPQIAMELLTAAGLEPDEVDRRMPTLWPLYLEVLERELETRRDRGTIGPLPGVLELLARLEADREVALGLMTGNLETAARLKLTAAGISTSFSVGGFGSDAALRLEIAQTAVSRARATFGREFDGPAVVIIGDTPDDVACARAVGGRSVGVATGRHTGRELASAGADRVYPDLSDTGRVLQDLRGSLGRAKVDSGERDEL